MKKIIVLLMICLLAVSFFVSCETTEGKQIGRDVANVGHSLENGVKDLGSSIADFGHDVEKTVKKSFK